MRGRRAGILRLTTHCFAAMRSTTAAMATAARQAIAAYARAVELDPNYAHAYARLALARIQLATRFPSEAGDVREEGEKARREAAMALRLAPDSAAAHAANAAWMAGIALDQAGAMHETMRALELSPQDPDLLHSLAIQQTAFGQLEEAAGNLRRVLALNPLSSTRAVQPGRRVPGQERFFRGRIHTRTGAVPCARTAPWCAPSRRSPCSSRTVPTRRSSWRNPSRIRCGGPMRWRWRIGPRATARVPRSSCSR